MSTPSLGDMLDRLNDVIASREGSDPETSYVAAKLAKGAEHCAKKVGEEAVETVMAAVQVPHAGPAPLVAESADLLFHLLILWRQCGVSPADIAAELAKRDGISGHEEKAGRIG